MPLENDLSSAESLEEHSLKSRLHRFFQIRVNVLPVIYVLLLLLPLIMVFLVYISLPVSYRSPLAGNVTKHTASLVATREKEKEVIGFLPSWTVSQNVTVKTDKLTQLIYFGLGVNPNGELVLYTEDKKPTLEWQYFTSDYFTTMRKEASASGTKVLITIKNFDNESIDTLISNKISVNRFLRNLVDLIEEYKLDGVNLDFEYFTDSNFPTAKFLTAFVQDVSKTLKTINAKLIVSVDVNASVVFQDRAYDMVKLGEAADQIILMAYDFHKKDSTIAGPVAPLFSNAIGSIVSSYSFLVRKVPGEKIILGIPLYGYEWQTATDTYGSFTIPQSGALATIKRVMLLTESRNDVQKHWDSLSRSPWLSYRQGGAIKQIYYEDARSIGEKITFMKKQGMGGIALWALGYEGDDQSLWDIIGRRK